MGTQLRVHIEIREPSNEYQHDKVKMVFKNRCAFVLSKKLALIGRVKTIACLSYAHSSPSLSFLCPSFSVFIILNISCYIITVHILISQQNM